MNNILKICYFIFQHRRRDTPLLPRFSYRSTGFAKSAVFAGLGRWLVGILISFSGVFDRPQPVKKIALIWIRKEVDDDFCPTSSLKWRLDPAEVTMNLPSSHPFIFPLIPLAPWIHSHSLLIFSLTLITARTQTSHFTQLIFEFIQLKLISLT